MMKLPPHLEIRPLAKVSPSSAYQLHGCKLRVAFSASKAHQDALPSSPAARIGKVFHKLVEEAADGEFSGRALIPVDQRIRQRWDELIAVEVESVGKSAHELHAANPKKWPNYSRRRARAIDLALRLSKEVDAERTSNVNADRSSGWMTANELWVSGFDGRIEGRADRIESRGGRLRIIDYKTGSIHEENVEGEDQFAIKDSIRRQLLLYAAVYHQEHGIWPDEGVISGQAQGEVIIEIDPAEATATANEALAALAEVNGVFESGKSLFELASPSPENCRWCGYRAMCPSYWESVGSDWMPDNRADFKGSITKIDDLGTAGWLVTFNLSAGTIDGQTARMSGVTSARFPNRSSITDGMEIVVVSARVPTPDHPADVVPHDGTELWFLEQNL